MLDGVGTVGTNSPVVVAGMVGLGSPGAAALGVGEGGRGGRGRVSEATSCLR